MGACSLMELCLDLWLQGPGGPGSQALEGPGCTWV